jgi:predicted RNase H-like nuclease (RuvC/YqgF family)
MSPVQSSLYIFHEFVVEHLFEVSGILALCLVFSYHLLPHTAYSDAFDDEEEEQANEETNEDIDEEANDEVDDEKDEEVDDEVDDEVDEVEDEKEVDEMTFEERLDYIETSLSKQLELMQKLNRIEQLSEQIEAEKAKGDILARIETVEQKKLVYEFNISGFYNFCRLVYADVKSTSRIKKRSYIIKKVGKMWRSMEDEEKGMYI